MYLHRALRLLSILPHALAFRPMIKMVTSADGTQIYADATGDPNKQSIVFVHGFSLSGLVFDNFFTNHKLRDNYYLVRYDARGHGRSDKPDSADAYTTLHYAQDFAAVMKAFNLHYPVFVGWSLGGAIISDIVEHLEPIPLRGAVAMDASPVLGPDVLPRLIAPSTMEALSLILQDTNVTSSLDGRIQFIDSCFEHPSQVPFRLKTEYLGQTILLSPQVATFAAQRPQNSTKLFAAGEAGKLHLQVLFGSADKVAMEAKAVEFVKPHFKKLTVTTIPGGHAVFEDNPDGTVDALDKFIRTLPHKNNPLLHL